MGCESWGVITALIARACHVVNIVFRAAPERFCARRGPQLRAGARGQARFMQRAPDRPGSGGTAAEALAGGSAGGSGGRWARRLCSRAVISPTSSLMMMSMIRSRWCGMTAYDITRKPQV